MDLIFVIPIIAVVLVGLFFFGWQFDKGNKKEAAFNIVRTVAYGGLFLLALFIIYTWLYFSGGGH